MNGAAPTNPQQASGLLRVRASRSLLIALPLLAAGLALVAAPAGADERYSLLATPQAQGLAGSGTSIDTLRAAPEAGRDTESRYRLSVRSTGDASQLDEADNAFAGSRMFEAVGGYHQELGGGFGYGLNLGLGMETRPDWNDLGPASESTAYFTDFSFGPTFATGRFDSQFRVGVRQPLSADEPGFGYGTRYRETGRTAGYLSLDGRLRLQNQSELSLSLYYDQYSLNSADNWLADRLEFEGASREPTSSVIGVEMGLTF